MVKALTYYKRKLINTAISPQLTLASEDDSLNNDLILSSSPQSLILTVTLEQYTKLLSSALNGAYLTYPDDYNNVIYPLIKAGKMSLCDEILQCIQNTPEIQQEISTISLDPVTAPIDVPFNTVISNSNLLTDANVITCNKDNFFGAMTGMIDLMNNIALDVIEFLAASTNVAGRLGDTIEMIPLVGELPVDDILQLTESLMDDMEQNYQANYTQALRDEYRCELFCIGKDDCEITFQEIFDYFLGKVGQSIPINDFLAFVQWFVSNPLTSVTLVHGWHAFLAGVLNFAGSVIDIDSAKFIKMVSALYNDPDPDWTILCSCTETFYMEVDFTVSDGGFTAVSGNRAVYSPGIGWTGANDGTVTRDYIRYSLPSGITITDIEARISRTPARPAGVWTIGVSKSGVYSDYNSVVSGSALPYPTYITWSGSRGDAETMVCDINSSQGNTTMLNDRIRMTFLSEVGIPAQLIADGWTEYTP